MICGEYAVLNGATAFVLPTKKGQHLKVDELEKNGESHLFWKAIDSKGNEWFNARIRLPELILEECSDSTIAIQLMRFLINAKVLNPKFLNGDKSFSVTTKLEFDNDEGLGSSSTLTNNIALWAEVNPYSLHFNAFKGSGFDVAVAKEGKALLYTMNGSEPIVETLVWNKPFKDKLYFIHLNKKQNSREQIAAYQKRANTAQVAQISRISRLLSVNDDYFEFCLLLELAENEISQLTGLQTVKQLYFQDFTGTIKSLGAWGGDYILACGDDSPEYFKSKGYERIVPFNEMIQI